MGTIGGRPTAGPPSPRGIGKTRTATSPTTGATTGPTTAGTTAPTPCGPTGTGCGCGVAPKPGRIATPYLATPTLRPNGSSPAAGSTSAGGISVVTGVLSISGAASPPIVVNRLGGGNDAIQGAAGMVNIAASSTLSPVQQAGGGGLLNTANGNLMLQLSPPAGDASYIPPVLVYNSTNATTSSEIGNGWSHIFKRQVQLIGGTNPAVITGAGQQIPYTGESAGGYQAPMANASAVNSLFAEPFFAAFYETAPDGTTYVYGSPSAGSLATLSSVQSPAGASWTVTYDSSQRVSSILDPFGRFTTLNYDATSGKITSILDPFGRHLVLGQRIGQPRADHQSRTLRHQPGLRRLEPADCLDQSPRRHNQLQLRRQ